MPTLTPAQKAIYDRIITFYKAANRSPTAPQEITLGGLAGTGKTTLISELVKNLGAASMVCALAGKAAHVLRSKGVSNANTIHSTIYAYDEDPDGNPVFHRKSANELPISPGGLIIIDEASMVNEEIADDLRSFRHPLLFVGDHGQLPPIAPPDRKPFNLMENPVLRLEEIHRQALNSPIIRFAHSVRTDTPHDRNDLDDTCRVSPCDDLPQALADFITTNNRLPQVVVPFNSMRHSINRSIREHFDMPPDAPVVGDKIICLRNNRKFNIFNGMQATIKSIGPLDRYNYCITVEVDDGRIINDLSANRACFGTSTIPNLPVGLLNRHTFWDYAYALTCHKMQGSESPDVFVVEQPSNLWDANRWAYTAATRAKDTLHFFTDFDRITD